MPSSFRRLIALSSLAALGALLACSPRSVVIAPAVVGPLVPAPRIRSSEPPEAPGPAGLTEAHLKGLAWRSIGPANMGGRVASIALAPGNAKTIVIGYATGGVWKSTNLGTTFAPVFDRYETSSIGAVAVCDAPVDWPGWAGEDLEDDANLEELGRARIIWVGTGEGNGRNSSSWGHGVYRSTDGGEEFKHCGLEDTHDIAALAVRPDDPDVCFVAALGHLWGANEQRGVFRTTDGGKTWAHVLAVDEHTGACDVLMDPRHPDVLYAAMYHRRRTAFSYRSGGPTGGIFRSRDGGETWTKLTAGLPAQTGRIGLSVSASNPDIVMAVVESDEGGWIGDPFTNRMRTGGVFRSEDAGETWKRTSDFNPRAFYFSRLRIDPGNDQRVYLLGWTLYVSDDGGKTFRAGSAKVPHVDFHAMVIDPDDTDHLLIGTDGGLYVSWDRGKTWDFHNEMAVGQFYNVEIDHSDPYRVGGGLQDNGTWIGPSENVRKDDGEYMGRKGAITNHDWKFVFGGDGFHVAFDPEDPNIVYAEWQGGNISRIHLDTGIYRTLKPSPKEGQDRFRFNWNAPFFISPHEHTTLYLGGNHVFKLMERGQRWERISGDLSSQDPERLHSVGSDAETNATVVSLAESPLRRGMLWAGTDDGLVHVTVNDGEEWTDVTPDGVRGLYVSKIEPSHHNADTAYAAVDGHRSDRFEPMLFMTTDAGRSWASIIGDLPGDEPVKVVREDPKNPNVLYAGTERAAYVTIDRGGHWIKLNGESLPTVAVDDLKVHPREHDLVAGTHGRSIWILDDASPLSQLTPEVLGQALHVFEPLPAKPRYFLPYGDLWSDRMFIASNPPFGASISYWLGEYYGDEVKVKIEDAHGHQVIELTGSNRPGINRVIWDLQPAEDQRLGNPHQMPEFVPSGTYKVTVTCGKRRGETALTVHPAPDAE